jgi:electron transfer flavoprotein beta subunit
VRIVVCVKEVPDADRINELAQGRYLHVDATALDLDCQHIPFAMNMYDEQALTVARAFRAGRQDCEVVALSCAPQRPHDLLRRALELGSDAACWVSAERRLDNPRSVAYILSSAIRFLGGADVVLCGHQASDDDFGIVGPSLAVLLDAVWMGEVRQIEGGSGSPLVITRHSAGHEIVAEVEGPVVATIKDDCWEPPIAKAAHILASKRIQPVELGMDEIGVDEPRLARLETDVRRLSFEIVKTNGRCEFIEGPSLAAVADELVARFRQEGIV